jgi:hypothetical protein
LISDLDSSGRVKRSTIVVDTTQLIRAGLGARNLVEAVHAAMGMGDVRSRFAGLWIVSSGNSTSEATWQITIPITGSSKLPPISKSTTARFNDFEEFA